MAPAASTGISTGAEVAVSRNSPLISDRNLSVSGVTMISARNRAIQVSSGEPVAMGGVRVEQDDYVIADRSAQEPPRQGFAH